MNYISAAIKYQVKLHTHYLRNYRVLKPFGTKNTKEVRQILGFDYIFFASIPAHADLVRLLTQLTCERVPFIWTDQSESTQIPGKLL